MNIDSSDNIKYKKLFVLLAVFAILVNIKSIFTDYTVDSGYAVATSYRQFLGDHMISDMWEPHQTSAFLCTFLIWLYTSITKTTTGLVLFLHTMGVVIKGLITCMIFRTLKPYISSTTLVFMCIFFFTVSPKGIVLPEFSNMQLWFSIGLFCCLVKYLSQSQSRGYLFCAGLFLCLETIVYPSCLIVYIGVIILLLLYTKTKWKDILLLTTECLFIGISYIGYFIYQMGWSKFILNCQYIIMGDNSHNVGFLSKFGRYAQELLYCLLFFFVLGMIVFIINKIISYTVFANILNKKSINYNQMWGMLFFALLFICDFFNTLPKTNSNLDRFPIYIPILCFSIFILGKCNPLEKMIYIIGFTISGFSFGATLLFTNLSLYETLSYLILAVMVSFIPITSFSQTHDSSIKKTLEFAGVLLFLFLTLFYYGYRVRCVGGRILDIGGIVKSGPTMGIVSEYMTPYIMNTTLAEWKEYILPGDSVLIVSAENLDAIMYLYQENVVVSIDSTICTPTYTEKLLSYWELHPDKKPNVVVVECWYGEILVNQDSWIMNWLDTQFYPDSYIDGTFWRYYRQ